ncbi:hypothetical protein SCP_0115430 [Sparassis crispa]|uniref:Uncharacterized protein n=1 Tax=Sparassis crispa TaxID=139825 RepID=A0A401G909_9APHY|nr:hypothetical protein SCP_0115430 [Sparassis crispa]GBE78654.1 hypothetical protein SCP_0115430 [Sparassis crispa]
MAFYSASEFVRESEPSGSPSRSPSQSPVYSSYSQGRTSPSQVANHHHHASDHTLPAVPRLGVPASPHHHESNQDRYDEEIHEVVNHPHQASEHVLPSVPYVPMSPQHRDHPALANSPIMHPHRSSEHILPEVPAAHPTEHSTSDMSDRHGIHKMKSPKKASRPIWRP